MNERIRKLARKNADYWMNHYDRKSLADMELLHKDVEKFAKLIVNECADYANWYQANSRYTDIAKAIKEHFGVEE